MSPLLIGIASGLATAVCQSITYLLTRHYAETRAAAGAGRAGNQLVVLGHVWMGLFALLMAPFIWPHAVPWEKFAGPLAGNMAGYACGLGFQVAALRHAEASRVGPLMTAKLIFASFLVLAFGMRTGGNVAGISWLQWVAIPICVVAGISISFTGGKMKPRVLLLIMGGASSFAVSDYCITMMLAQARQMPEFSNALFRCSLFCGLLSYCAAGAVSVALLPWQGSRKMADWAEAFPFAVVWLGSMVGLYNAFALVGILLGQILQCTRGFITIIFGAAVMRLGHHHIEPHAPRRVIVRRLAAGVLMFFGISLYVLKDRATIDQLAEQLHITTPAPAGGR